MKNAKKKFKDDVDVLEQTFKEKASDLSEQRKTLGTTNTTLKKDDVKEHKKIQISFTAKEKRAVKRFEGMKQKERLKKLNTIAIHQMELLIDDHSIKKLGGHK